MSNTLEACTLYNLLLLVQKRRCLSRKANQKLTDRINKALKETEIEEIVELDRKDYIIKLYEYFTDEKVESGSWLEHELIASE